MIIVDSKFFLVNNIVGIVFFIVYMYQFVFIPVSIFSKKKVFPDADPRRYAIMICARNESNVIGNLIDSIRNQNYPRELIDVFVIADNCTDDGATAAVCRGRGADVIERFNTGLVGKGYALNCLVDHITDGLTKWDYEAYFVIDADNLLDENFILEMNKALASGCRAVTGYRNSKNYGDNWLSASYSLWYLREGRYLNNARQVLGGCAQVSGTGFAVSKDLLRDIGGWNYFTLTEDVEFTFAMGARHEKIAFCYDAIVYDEEPTKWRESWHQRTRWVKGYFQGYWKYGFKLLTGFLKGKFDCYDMLANTFMGAVLTVGLFMFYVVTAVLFSILRYNVAEVLICFGVFMGFGYFGVFIIGTITTITEWDRIYCSKAKKIKYIFTFPFFLITLMPNAVWAIFSRSHWPQVHHDHVMVVDDVINYDTEKYRKTQ